MTQTSLFLRFGVWLGHHRRHVLVTYAALLPFLIFAGTTVFPRLKAGGFEDPSREAWQAFDAIQRELKVGIGDVIAIYQSDRGTVEEPEVMGDILAVVGRLEADAGVTSVASVYSTGAPHFMSKDRTITFLLIDLNGDDHDKVRTFHRLRTALDADGLTLSVGGLVPTNIAVFDTIEEDLIRAELLAFPLTAVVVLLVFGSLASVFVLLCAGGVSIALAFAALSALMTVTDVSVFAVNTITILGLGLAVDYSLFLVNRFREELARTPDGDAQLAMARTLATTGRAVAFSAITVAASLAGLFAFEQMFLRSLALGGLFVVVCTGVLSLTLVPALLVELGPRIDAFRVPLLHALSVRTVNDNNLWARTARVAMRQPVLVVVLLTLLFVALASPFARFNGSLADTRLLPREHSVRAAHALLDSNFMPHQSTPHMVLVTLDQPAMQRDNLQRLAQLSDQMKAIPGVTRVDGVFSFAPGTERARVIDALLKVSDKDPLHDQLQHFVKGPYMRFSLLSEQTFDGPLSMSQVVALRALSTPGMKIEVAGYAAALIDLREAIRTRAPVMVGIVLLCMAVILFLVFGSITLPIKAMLMNALSLTASYGAIVWIFQDGRLATLLNYEPLYFSDSGQPLVMFAIAFGLSMDYEVLILARIREEYLRTGNNTEAVALGLARTGRLISSAALLLVVVVSAMATSQIVFIKALGVGMAIAIALDATLVRALLVPATMKLMGRYNWYAPEVLKRWWIRTGLSDHSSH